MQYFSTFIMIFCLFSAFYTKADTAICENQTTISLEVESGIEYSQTYISSDYEKPLEALIVIQTKHLYSNYSFSYSTIHLSSTKSRAPPILS